MNDIKDQTNALTFILDNSTEFATAPVSDPIGGTISLRLTKKTNMPILVGISRNDNKWAVFFPAGIGPGQSGIPTWQLTLEHFKELADL